MAIEPGKAPTVAVIGLACLLGSAVLAWLSSPTTLILTRDNEDRVAAVIESRLFGVFPNSTEHIERIRSVSNVRYDGPGQPSDTPDRIVFETRSGSVDLGRNQQLFAVDYPEIAAFFRTDGPSSLTLSSITRGSELRRFFFAQAAALGMLLAGLGLGWTHHFLAAGSVEKRTRVNSSGMCESHTPCGLHAQPPGSLAGGASL